MGISKLIICNFKIFKGVFKIEFTAGTNILVGVNGSGKSTILEAIHLALTGVYNGRTIKNELSQHLFNRGVVEEYLESLKLGKPKQPPEILIEVHFDEDIAFPEFEGNFNFDKLNEVKGLRFTISFDSNFNGEYEKLISKGELNSLPVEYYDVSWKSFARDSLTPRAIPIKSAMIDSSTYRYQNGSDVYISRIVKGLLTDEEIANVSQAHRKMSIEFSSEESIQTINEKIKNVSSIVDGTLSMAADFGTKNAWENSLITQLNDIPFDYIGKGDQCVIKTELALNHPRSAKKTTIILMEEPENHLSYAKLNQLMRALEKEHDNKQIIISTHSSFVANKLGLNNLILINNLNIARFEDLKSENFFKKIAGYDTLRFLLSKRAILVEGDSDELVVQKAYMDLNGGELPIFRGIDVISVGTSFLRYLELAKKLQKRVVVVTDNDGNLEALEKKYSDYIGGSVPGTISIFYPGETHGGRINDLNWDTLEAELLRENGTDFLNDVFNKKFKKARWINWTP